MLSVLQSHLDDNQLSAIQHLDKELGNPLYAYTAVYVKVPSLSNEELSKVIDLESKLHVHLLALSP